MVLPVRMDPTPRNQKECNKLSESDIKLPLTVAARLPKNMKVQTSVSSTGTQIAVELTMTNADEARALMVAIEKAIIPLFEIAERPGLPKSEAE